MFDYFVNAGMSFIPFGVAALCVLLVSFLPRLLGADQVTWAGVVKAARHLATLVVIFGFTLALTYSANTYKRQDVNKAQLIHQQEQINLQRTEKVAPQELRDVMSSRTRSKEQLKADFDSMVNYKKEQP